MTKRSCVVIVEVTIEGEPVVMGLIADAVNQVIELGADDIEPPPSFGTRVDVAYLKGMGRADKRFVLLLEIERVLSSDEAQEVAAVGAEAPPPAPSSGGAARIVASLLLALALGRGLARAEEPIQDNSFLIEEAYNQERGVVQHISALLPRGGERRLALHLHPGVAAAGSAPPAELHPARAAAPCARRDREHGRRRRGPQLSLPGPRASGGPAWPSRRA